ncbi:MAG: carbohydrate kinase [Zetaproteobacteria bacterium CG12_big_fil_rev_8_21_14_0_65_54_13]|nr:MAG: carbohydrate kinase [Zetaproteobacteria bacterium CG23_combo_of_CG06-09_8_20_14_all_54_7]PIW46248.1 MAG: carbohydrate kinase [Zetaproteobacteria bacterium CG12_big_fil_rev_8_21_14_0_65_54_13]PIX54844.1 MAG: carbohydrate kinase [Zetaproteobacteria bacterium CG_4_10_14_3_um_filter_54_28]PJA29844.1 MAG: carbohydrate kinase [Zetaproteobacteria bacterium CG_4_9_14_3_um_filter_54_145]
MNHTMMRPLIFGEVLFDRFPDGSVVLGGAPFNVAWHLHAFGLKPLMISRIGRDALGSRVEAAMHDWGMDCSGMQTDNVHPTGTVEVSFVEGEPSYDIAQAVAYDFIDAARLPQQADGEWLLYHGSLALRNPCSAAALAKLEEQTACCRFVDINLREPWWQRDAVLAMMKGAAWLKLNEAELAEICPEATNSAQRIDQVATMISQHIVLTGGERGATAISSVDGSRHAVVPERVSSVLDTVGAGDAFCSVFVAGRLLGWPIDLSMQRAQAFASAVVGIRGATAHDRAFYRQFTREWGIKGDHDV